MSERMPVLFVAHGAPPLLDDAGWLGELRAWGDALPRPKAILMVSAHWEERPATLGATAQVPLVYDFYGFPARYYQTQYAAPGAPALAARVRELLTPSQPVADDPQRGRDHGAFVPLIGMYPDADVPVLQLLDYQQRAPGVAQALPTHEHFAPLVLAAGAGGASDPVRFPIDGFWLGSFTRRSVQLG